MSSKKTISDLPSWGGDPSMRMHVHKPGSSQALTLSEFASLVTTGEGLQTGDIVLRPNGSYADALECDGKLRPTADYPVLAGKLNFGAFGTTPISVNANSGTRFGATYTYNVKQLGRVKVASESGYMRVYVNNVLSSSVGHYSTINTSVFKTDRGIYFKERKSSGSESVYFVSPEGLLSVVWTAAGILDVLGAVSISPTLDVIFLKTSTGVSLVKYDTTSAAQAVVIGSLDAQGSTPAIAQQAANGNVYFMGTLGSVRGLYKLTITANSVSYVLVAEGSHARLVGGKSNYVFYGAAALEYRLNAENDVSTKVVFPAGFDTGVAHGASFVTLNGTNGTRPIMSFDGGASWENVPEMSGYRGVDYDHTAGEIVVCGSAGTTGSVSGQSGAIQNNAMNFPSEIIFRLPKITSAVTGLKAYIKT